MTVVQDCGGGGSGFSNYLQRCRESRKLVLVIVAIALLLDNMLLTTVVPIIPEFLYEIRHPNETYTAADLTTTTTTIQAPSCNNNNNKDVNQTSNLEYLNEQTTASYDTGNLTTLSPVQIKQKKRHKDLVEETVAVGMMFASKAFVQLLANPIVGPLTHRIGYSIPMFTGFIIMFLSTLIFAFGRSYTVLFLARALQGIGSSCSSVSGMGMLAERYPDDKERGNAMGIALGGIALGVLIGPPFGGLMYEFVGKSAPFLVLSALALGDGHVASKVLISVFLLCLVPPLLRDYSALLLKANATEVLVDQYLEQQRSRNWILFELSVFLMLVVLQLLMLQPGVVHQESDPPSLKSLVMDPYIIIAAGAITFANMGIAMLEPSLPIWMMDKMSAERWEQGITFLPASISYLIGTNLFGPLGHRMGRWLASLLGLFIIGICLICIPFANDMNDLIVPNAGLGFAIGMVDSSMMPELGYLVDIRHTAVYGSVYAIGDVAFCLGFAIGPAISGTLVNTIGFDRMLYGIAVLNFLYAPLMYILRSPPTKEEKKSLILGEKSSVRYVTYQNEEDDE